MASNRLNRVASRIVVVVAADAAGFRAHLHLPSASKQQGQVRYRRQEQNQPNRTLHECCKCALCTNICMLAYKNTQTEAIKRPLGALELKGDTNLVELSLELQLVAFGRGWKPTRNYLMT